MAERNLTAEDLYFLIRQQTGERMSVASITKYLQGDPQRMPKDLERYEWIASALDVEPMVFDEYRLGLARRMLDEKDLGLEQALANLEALRPALLAGRLEPLEEALRRPGEEQDDQEALARLPKPPARQTSRSGSSGRRTRREAS